MSNLPPPPVASSVLARIGTAFGLGFGLFIVGMIVMKSLGATELPAPVPGLLMLGLLAVCSWVIYVTPGKIKDSDDAEFERWREKPQALGKAKNPAATGPELQALLRKYPNWSELIEAVHANPAYAKHVRGED